MRVLLTLIVALAIAGCTRNPAEDRTGMMADVATTAAVLSTGGVEANPALSFLNDMQPVPQVVAMVAVKVGIEKTMEYMIKDNPNYAPDFPKRALNAAGWGAACWNAGVYLSIAGPVGAAAGLGCAVSYWEWTKNRDAELTR